VAPATAFEFIGGVTINESGGWRHRSPKRFARDHFNFAFSAMFIAAYFSALNASPRAL
jgi:hypothetical protein